jgi:hypothetical protein
MFGNGVILFRWGVPFVVFTELIVEARAVSNVECRMSSAVIYRSLRKAMCGGAVVSGEIHNGK